jgi:hypothetical protein
MARRITRGGPAQRQRRYTCDQPKTIFSDMLSGDTTMP